MDIQLNDADKAVYSEEQSFLQQAEELKAMYGGIRQIPASEIIAKGFVRILIGKKYVLFKKMEKGSGAVVVRE